MALRKRLTLLGIFLCLPLITLHAEEADSSNKEIIIPLFHPKPANWHSAQISMTPRGCETPTILIVSLTEDRSGFSKFELRTEETRLVVPEAKLKTYLFPRLEETRIRAWCPDELGNQTGGYLITLGYTGADGEYDDSEDEGVLVVTMLVSGDVTIEKAPNVDSFFDKNRSYRTLRKARWHAASIEMTPLACERNVRLDIGLSSDRRRFTGLSQTMPSGHFTAPLGELSDFSYPVLEEMRLVGWCSDPEYNLEEGYEVSIPYSLARVEYALEEEMSEMSATFSASGDIEICDDYDFLPCWEEEDQ